MLHHPVPLIALRLADHRPAPRLVVWLAVAGALCSLGAVAAVLAIPVLAGLDLLLH